MPRLQLPLLWLLRCFRLTTGGCSGSSIFCDRETTQSDCEFWSGCTWSSSSSVTASCTGSFSSCASHTTERDCNMWASCTWGTGGSSSSSGTGISNSFCFAKLDGGHCNGNTAFNCEDGEITSSQYCSAGDCQEFGFEAACGDPNFCAAKLDGRYCDGQYVKVCSSSSSSVEVQDCRSAGCSEFVVGDASCGSANFCAAKLDGTYCDGSVVKTCPSEAVVAVCREVSCQESSTASRTASCGDPTFCRAKLDGSYCDGAYSKTCSDSTQTAMLYCGQCSQASIGITECGTARFCVAKISGDYCDGDVWKRCDGSSTPSSMVYCDGGCVEWRLGVAGCGEETDGWVGGHAHKQTLGGLIALTGLLQLVQ